MKKVVLPIVMIAYVSILVYTAVNHVQSISDKSNQVLEYMLMIMFAILIIAGILLFIKKYKMVLEGATANDEMTKKMIHRSASLSFFVSLLFWLLLAVKFDEMQIESGELYVYGIFGMVTIFILFLTYFSFKGVRE